MKHSKATYKLISILLVTIFITSCISEKNRNKKMEIKKHIIENNNQKVLEYSVRNNQLHGECIWYAHNGVMIASGVFKDGKPYTGSFLNWSKVIDNIFLEDNYEVKTYCRDWISFYESGFDSKSPDYTSFLEFYDQGKRVE